MLTQIKLNNIVLYHGHPRIFTAFKGISQMYRSFSLPFQMQQLVINHLTESSISMLKAMELNILVVMVVFAYLLAIY